MGDLVEIKKTLKKFKCELCGEYTIHDCLLEYNNNELRLCENCIEFVPLKREEFEEIIASLDELRKILEMNEKLLRLHGEWEDD